MWRSWVGREEEAIVGGDQQDSLEDVIFPKIPYHRRRSHASSPFPSGTAKAGINVVHFHLTLPELEVEMFPPQLSTARSEGRENKRSGVRRSKNNPNPSDYVSGSTQGSSKVSDLESNNFSSAVGASTGCWEVWC